MFWKLRLLSPPLDSSHERPVNVALVGEGFLEKSLLGSKFDL
jgi:hypothetical protein